jgi:transposase
VPSATLPAALPELGGRNPRELAQVVGMAPRHGERGKRSGTRHLRGGRAEGRAVWSMATPTATRGHPGLNAFSPRLRARGQAQKVALTAARRKLLILLPAMVKTHPLGHARITNCPVPEQAP